MKKRFIYAMLLAFSTIAFGCMILPARLGGPSRFAPGKSVHERDDGRRNENADLIGEIRLTFRSDMGTLSIGRDVGPFQRLVFQAEGNDVEIERIVVIYTDGHKSTIPMHNRFNKGNKSSIVDLEGNKRFIQSIAFYNRKDERIREDRVNIQVFGIR
ncbi:MAG: hypothetical protein WCT14_11035 [Treponemataceae bacterium]